MDPKFFFSREVIQMGPTRALLHSLSDRLKVGTLCCEGGDPLMLVQTRIVTMVVEVPVPPVVMTAPPEVLTDARLCHEKMFLS